MFSFFNFQLFFNSSYILKTKNHKKKEVQPMSLHEIKGIGGEIQVGMPYIGYTKNNEIFKTSPVVEYRRDNNGVYIQTDNGNVYASGNY